MVFPHPGGPLAGALPFHVPSPLPVSLLVGGRTGWQDAVGEGPAHVSPLFPGRDYMVSKETAELAGGWPGHSEGKAEEEGRLR